MHDFHKMCLSCYMAVAIFPRSTFLVLISIMTYMGPEMQREKRQYSKARIAHSPVTLGVAT